jgi:hypothetical protein
MKEKILQDALEWYENQEEKPDVNLEDFVDLVIKKTTDAIFDEIGIELKNEFEKGNLKHPFVISSDYYLDLKLKEIKGKFVDLADEDASAEEF